MAHTLTSDNYLLYCSLEAKNLILSLSVPVKTVFCEGAVQALLQSYLNEKQQKPLDNPNCLSSNIIQPKLTINFSQLTV